MSSVYDGDTFYAGIKKDENSSLEIIRIRIARFDTAEISKPRCEKEAQLAQQHRTALVNFLEPTVFVSNIRIDEKWPDRYIADVYTSDGVHVAWKMLQEGHGVVFGYGKPNWCL